MIPERFCQRLIGQWTLAAGAWALADPGPSVLPVDSCQRKARSEETPSVESVETGRIVAGDLGDP